MIDSEKDMDAGVNDAPVNLPLGAASIGLPLVAIVGRPNVGKSTLFNRLIGQRRSITGDEPGITRDRIYGEAEWAGRQFSIVDTGGIIPDDEAAIPASILKQASIAIHDSRVLLWVVDGRIGLTPADEELARLLRASGKPVFIAANKLDEIDLESHAADFSGIGFPVFAISAETGNGAGDLLDAILEHITPTLEGGLETTPAPSTERSGLTREIRLAIVGRPNVGKSSLLNRLLGAERVIISPIPGTTRDAVDTLLERGGLRFRLIDTAGIRRKGKTGKTAEALSVVMARRSLERADVAVIVIDATEGVVATDAHIAGYAYDAGCSVIIAINKWDAVPDKKTATAFEFARKVRDEMKFLDWAPILTISALNGQRVDKIFALAERANEARGMRIPTSELNVFFEETIASPGAPTSPAPVRGGRSRLRVRYVTQVGVRPPKFVIFTAGGKPGLHFSYERYLQNRLRERFGFFATPLRIIERHRQPRAR